jgi:riboflavin transporter 2
VFSGIWVESTLLSQKLPEGWAVPSKIGAVSQLAQIGPVLLFLLKCKCVSCFKNQRGLVRSLRRFAVSDRVIIYFLFFVGLIAGALLALFWDKTSVVFGREQSVTFFVCVFFLALLDCTCTIVFLTYIGNFRGNYITGLYIGEGISSLLPSLFALLQGTSDEEPTYTSHKTCPNLTFNNGTFSQEKVSTPPRFGVSVYFWLLFATLVVSFLAFLALEFWPSFAKEKLDTKKKERAAYRNCENDEFDEHNVVNQRLMNQIEIEKLASEHHARMKKKESADMIVLLVAVAFVSL